MKLLTQAYLKERLHYDHEIGVFRWRAKSITRPQDQSWNTRYAGKVAGSLHIEGYISIAIDDVAHLAQRLAWLYMKGEWPEADVDHRNRDRSDNRFSNLRPATRIQNCQNASLSKNNTSGFAGVTFDKQTGKWAAQITVARKNKRLGRFEDKNAAVHARRTAEARYFGAFAPTLEAGAL